MLEFVKEWDIEDITDKMKINSKTYYYMKWASNYVPSLSLINAKELVAKFEATRHHRRTKRKFNS